MKKIIKDNSKTFGVQKFTCHWRDSVFESDEYETEKSTSIGEWSFFRGFRITPVYLLYTDCPVCERGTSIRVPAGEPSYWSGHAD